MAAKPKAHIAQGREGQSRADSKTHSPPQAFFFFTIQEYYTIFKYSVMIRPGCEMTGDTQRERERWQLSFSEKPARSHYD